MGSSPGPELGAWWKRPPRRARLTYAVVAAIAVGAVIGFLFVVPVPQSTATQYTILVGVPSNASVPSCQGVVFYQTGTYNFNWFVPNGNPTSLNVTDSEGGPTLYTGLTWGEASGSIPVGGPASYYVFCLTVRASTLVEPGSQSVVTVSGALIHKYYAPTL
jgi:hypothetical protein